MNSKRCFSQLLTAPLIHYVFQFSHWIKEANAATDLILPGNANHSNDELLGPIRTGPFFVRVSPISGDLGESAQETLQTTVINYVHRKMKESYFAGMTYQRVSDIEVTNVGYDDMSDSGRNIHGRRRLEESVTVVKFGSPGFFFDVYINDSPSPVPTLRVSLEEAIRSDAFKLALQVSIDSQLQGITDVGFGFTATSSPIQLATPSPTRKPSPSPTSTPTESHTVPPTLFPTHYPSSKPTMIPTKMPTPAPTLNPIKKPTSDPTKIPTSDPTKIPTLDATKIPTVHPSRYPQSFPTPYPTESFTHIPSSWSSSPSSDDHTTAPTNTQIIGGGRINDTNDTSGIVDEKSTLDDDSNTTIPGLNNNILVVESNVPVPAIAASAVVGLSIAALLLLIMKRRKRKTAATHDEDSSWNKSTDLRGKDSLSNLCPFPPLPKAISSSRRATMDNMTVSTAIDASFDMDIGCSDFKEDAASNETFDPSFEPDDFSVVSLEGFGRAYKDSQTKADDKTRNKILQPSRPTTIEMESRSISSGSDAFKSLDWDPDEHWDPDDTSPEEVSSQAFSVAFGDSMSLMSDSPSKMDKRKITPYRLDFIEYDDDSVNENVIL